MLATGNAYSHDSGDAETRIVMRTSHKNRIRVLAGTLLVVAWLAAYQLLPYLSPLDGPFDARPFGFDHAGLPTLSEVELKVLGVTAYVLEARQNQGAAPGTVFVLRDRDGSILWSRLGANELGLIRFERHAARWFPPGGWVVDIKPEYTGAGEIYISPLGQFRFFFHRW